jgi:hypothetical protein
MLCALNDNSSRSHNSLVVYRAAEDNRNHVKGTHLDVTDEGAVPEGFEDEVGKAQDGEVLDELLPKVVVDSEDLLLTQMSLQVLVQLPAALQVFTEGFLHDDTRPPGSAQHSPHLPSSQTLCCDSCASREQQTHAAFEMLNTMLVGWDGNK